MEENETSYVDVSSILLLKISGFNFAINNPFQYSLIHFNNPGVNDSSEFGSSLFFIQMDWEAIKIYG